MTCSRIDEMLLIELVGFYLFLQSSYWSEHDYEQGNFLSTFNLQTAFKIYFFIGDEDDSNARKAYEALLRYEKEILVLVY